MTPRFRSLAAAFRRGLYRRWRLLGLLPLLVTAGCSPARMVNALVPREGYTVTKDIAYGDSPRQRLDVYRPDPPRADAPVVVFLYGGNWDSGSKAMYRFAGQALASKGFVTVIPDYRLYPEVRYPAFLEDCAKAVRWTVDHAHEFGGDPQRIALMGHSAGAYNAAMLTLDPQWLAQVGLSPKNNIRAMVGLAGPYDFLPLQSARLKKIFGPKDQRPATQPINYVTGVAPPILLIYGTGDTIVEPANSIKLAKKLRSVGSPVKIISFDGIGHIQLVGSLAFPTRFLAPTLEDSVKFLDAEDR